MSGNPVKQQDGLFVLRRGEVSSVGAEGDAVDQSMEAPDVSQHLAGGGVPEEDGVPARGDPASVVIPVKTEDDAFLAGQGPQQLARCRIPEDELLVEARRGEGLAVGRIGDGLEETGVPLQGHQGLPGQHVPDHDGAVVASRGKPLPVGAEGHGVDYVAVPLENPFDTPLFQIPDDDAAVVACRGQPFPVGTEGQGNHPAVVPGERSFKFSRRRVPQVDELVFPAGGNGLAVGAEGDPHDRFLVGAQGVDGNARVCIPDDDVLVGAPRGDGPAVGAEGHAPDDRRVPLESPVGPAAEGRAEEVTREESLDVPHDPRLLPGLDILLLVGGETGAAGGKRKQAEKADNPCRTEMTMQHGRPLTQQEVRKSGS